MLNYHGRRRPDGTTAVCVTTGETSPVTKVLELEPSLKVRNHSPTGFEWGYNGSGPAQLALAILLDYFGRQDIDQRPHVATARQLAEEYHQQFKSDVIGAISVDVWQLTADQIEAWLTVVSAIDLVKGRSLAK